MTRHPKRGPRWWWRPGLPLLLALLLPLAAPARAQDTPGEAVAAAAEADGEADGEVAPEVDGEALLDRVIAHLAAIRTLSGTYTQLTMDGFRAHGTFDFEFPNKMHFAELAPTRNRLIADGTWIASVEEGAGQAVRYPLTSTPFAVLLSGDLADRSRYRVVKASRQRDGERWRYFLTLSLAEGEAAGVVTLLFLDPPLQFEGWIIRDAQAGSTLVRLTTEEVNQPIDPNRFRIHLHED